MNIINKAINTFEHIYDNYYGMGNTFEQILVTRNETADNYFFSGITPDDRELIDEATNTEKAIVWYIAFRSRNINAIDTEYELENLNIGESLYILMNDEDFFLKVVRNDEDINEILNNFSQGAM